MAHDLLLSSCALQRGYFNPAEIIKFLHKHSLEVDHSAKLWDLLILELWHQTFIDGDGKNLMASVPTDTQREPTTPGSLLSAS